MQAERCSANTHPLHNMILHLHPMWILCVCADFPTWAIAVPDQNGDISYFPAKHHVHLWYCREDMLKILPTLLTHLCTGILGTPARKSSIPQEEAVASDTRFDVLTGAMQKT